MIAKTRPIKQSTVRMEEEQRKASLLSLLEEVAAEEGFRKPNIQTGGGTELINGFIGTVHRVLVEETESGLQKPCLNLVVKCMPASKARREWYQTTNFFSNEAVYYNEIIPAFRAFQNEKGITKNLSPPHPRCLKAGEVLIMEDQSPLGFVMKDTRETLDYVHCLLVMRELGRLHAVSFALRDQRPALFKRLSTAVKDALYIPGGLLVFRKFVEPSAALALKRFQDHPKYSQAEKKKYIDAVKDYSIGFYDQLAKTQNSEDAEPYAVIGHGDCWSSNLLFKYKQHGEDPEAVCMLDYQTAKYASPACDISYFIYCSTDKASRRAHYHQLLEQYHSSLAEYLARLGSDVNKLFPMEALQEQMRRFGKFGVGTTMVYMPNLTSRSFVGVAEMDAACEAGIEKLLEVITGTHSKDSPCWERICDTIIDGVDYGYIF